MMINMDVEWYSAMQESSCPTAGLHVLMSPWSALAFADLHARRRGRHSSPIADTLIPTLRYLT